MKIYTISVYGFLSSSLANWKERKIADVEINAKSLDEAFQKVQEMYPRASRFEYA